MITSVLGQVTGQLNQRFLLNAFFPTLVFSLLVAAVVTGLALAGAEVMLGRVPAWVQVPTAIAVSLLPVTYFTLAWFLKKNGLTVKDVTVVNMEPAPAAQAFIAGQNDVAMTYEPYLSAVRDKPEAGKIIATTLDYPMVMDTFGCTPKFIAENEAAVKALVKSYFEAADMIKADPKKSYEIMGADVKQSGEQFGNSAKYLRWQDQAANKTFFTGEFNTFSKEAADLLLEIGVIKQIPDLSKLADTKFIQ